jgi:succinate dehydrogenase / fumarate reductase flavoprotein subunit
MSRYAPSKMELGPRDVVSRSIQTELDEGRGIAGGDFVHLDLRHLGRATVRERLPQVRQLGIDLVGVDCLQRPLPIRPTAHYTMGGVPTDLDGRVLSDGMSRPLAGLFAAGESACVSVHGANRLGSNSLLEATVFGRRAGRSMAAYAHDAPVPDWPNDAVEPVVERIDRLLARGHGERWHDVGETLRAEMTARVGVYRERPGLERARGTLHECRQRYASTTMRPFSTPIWSVRWSSATCSTSARRS